MFPACCFCQGTSVAQGLLKGHSMRLELTPVSSINLKNNGRVPVS